MTVTTDTDPMTPTTTAGSDVVSHKAPSRRRSAAAARTRRSRAVLFVALLVALGGSLGFPTAASAAPGSPIASYDRPGLVCSKATRLIDVNLGATALQSVVDAGRTAEVWARVDYYDWGARRWNTLSARTFEVGSRSPTIYGGWVTSLTGFDTSRYTGAKGAVLSFRVHYWARIKGSNSQWIYDGYLDAIHQQYTPFYYFNGIALTTGTYSSDTACRT